MTQNLTYLIYSFLYRRKFLLWVHFTTVKDSFLGLARKSRLYKLYEKQWGSEYWTCPLFKWLKVVPSPNGLVFECHLNNGLNLVRDSDLSGSIWTKLNWNCFQVFLAATSLSMIYLTSASRIHSHWNIFKQIGLFEIKDLLKIWHSQKIHPCLSWVITNWR